MAADTPSRRRPPPAKEPIDQSDLSVLDAKTDADEYSVGRGRPPRHSQFKSGNPGGPGRPKGSKNRVTLFEEAFDTPRNVTMEGQKRKMTAQALGYHQLARAVAKGDLKAIALAETIRNTLSPPTQGTEPIEEPLTEAEIAILRRRQ